MKFTPIIFFLPYEIWSQHVTTIFSPEKFSRESACGIFLDWESQAWLSLDKIPGHGSWCFCEKCKTKFKKFAQIPQNEKLDDSVIINKYHNKWLAFRCMLEGELQGVILNVLRKMNKRYMLYGQTANPLFWKACKGKTDLVFVGLPGSAAGNSLNQHMIDRQMRFFRNECNIDRIIGQRFSYSGYSISGPDKWQGLMASNDSGFVNAKGWKPQIIRLVATFNGGLDIESGLSFCGGMLYYLGESTKIIAKYEDLFLNGIRQDDLAESKQLAYPNLLVLRKGKERLVLLFNETTKAITVEVINKKLAEGQTAIIYGDTHLIKNPGKINLTVPPEDVSVIHIKK